MTHNLIYRAFNIRDTDEVFEMTSQNDIGYWCGWYPHQTKEDTIKAINSFWKLINCKAIIDSDINKIVGCISVTQQNSNSVEIGYWLGKQYRHKGYITQAVKETIDECFKDDNIDTIYCGYFAGNDASKKVNDRCGFKYDKTTEVFVPAFNEYRNEIITKITKDDV